MIKKKKLILQFNEANFDLIEKYVHKYNFLGLEKILLSKTKIITSSEKEYKHLEPWIQWYSFYTGLPYREHKIFHLGDCIHSKYETFLDNKNHKKKKIAIYSSMNLRPSKSYNIYIPDPWTNAESDNSVSSKYVSSSLKQIVNDNVRFSINIKSILGLLFIIGVPTSLTSLKRMFSVIFSMMLKSRSKLSAYLDYFFVLYSLRRSSINQIDISMIFMNGLAHAQHHFLNESEFVKSKKYELQNDPIYESLKIYDQLFKNIFNRYDKTHDIWTITGLTQKPFKKPLYYWRLRNHRKIIKYFTGLDIKLSPRMSRDFEIFTNNQNSLDKIELFLRQSKIIHRKKSLKAFSFISRKKNSIFATFAYNLENSDVKIEWKKKIYNLKNNIDFVARKNGVHSENGWAFCNNVKKIKLLKLPIWKIAKFI
tara:strand:+ start:1980 stop:3248 length:1269 start_codon:yes stop_codon:yes gene_type:complete